MSTKAIEYKFDDDIRKFSDYSDDKLIFGNTIVKLVHNGEDAVGPYPIDVLRFSQIGFVPRYFKVVTVNEDIDYIYQLGNTTSTSTSTTLVFFVYLIEFNKKTGKYNFLGNIQLQRTPTGNYSITSAIPSGFDVGNEFYTEGTISCNGTSLTGVGTFWQDDRLCAGSRIGFGSTNPNEITEWYEIESIDSNTGITLTSDAGIISSSTSYVIHDLRVTFSISGATIGGIYIVKGLRPELFNNSRPIINVATTIDNIRAVYIIRHRTINFSIAMDIRESWQTQRIYSIQSGPRIAVYNIRASLSPIDGIDNTSIFEFETGIQSVIGTLNYNDNGVVGTLNHGEISGIKSFFFITTTRIYQCDLSNITNGSTTWQNRQMVELQPTGLVNDLRTLSTFTTLNILDGLDRLIVSNSTKISIFKFIVGEPFELTFITDDRQLDDINSDSESIPHPSSIGFTSTIEYSNGFLHMMRLSTVSAQTQLYSLPITSNETFAFDTNDYLITPKFDISEFYKIYQITPNFVQKVGSDSFSLPNERFKIYYRVSGIGDNSGSWVELNQMGDLTSVNSSQIQFAIIFNTLGNFCIPSIIKSIFIVYEDNKSVDGYDPDLTKSSIEDKEFVWLQTGFFNGNLPDLKITLIDISNNTIILVDDTVDSSGVWEYSENNGETWNYWDITKNNLFNLIKYKSDSSLLNNKKVKTLLQIL
jgi:hypothetical protein